MKKILFSLAFMSVAVGAQQAPMFEVDTSWPKPLPGGWINGQVGGNCVDSHDHSVIVDRRNITEEEHLLFDLSSFLYLKLPCHVEWRRVGNLFLPTLQHIVLRFSECVIEET